MSSVRRGLIFSSFERYSVLLLGMSTTIVTARLLTPADFGIAVIGLAIFGLIDIFRDFGSGTYIIQVDDPTPERVQSVFTVTLMLALPLFLLTYFFAGTIAKFYALPGLESYLHVTAFCLLTSSFCSPAYALLNRNLQFDKLTILSLTTSSLNAVVTILLALAGFSYMSYAWAQLVSTVIYFGLCLMWGPKFPIYRFSLSEWRPVVRYGVYDSARALLLHLGDAAPFLAFGKTLGAASLGIYQRALSISRLADKTLLSGFAPVLQPAFSKHSREGRDLGKSFLLGIEHVTVLLWPALVGVVLLAHPLVMILLGAQWSSTVPIIQVLAMSSMICFPLSLCRPALIAAGGVRETAILAILTVPVVVAVQIAASFWGLMAVAWSFVLTNMYTVAVSLHFVSKHISLPQNDVLRALQKSFIVTLVSAVPLILAAIIADGVEQMPVAIGVGAAILSAISWFFAIHLTGHPIKNEIDRLLDAAAAVLFSPATVQNLKAVRLAVVSRTSVRKE